MLLSKNVSTRREASKQSGDLLGGLRSPLMRSHNEPLAEKLMLGKITEVSSPLNAQGSLVETYPLFSPLLTMRIGIRGLCATSYDSVNMGLDPSIRLGCIAPVSRCMKGISTPSPPLGVQ